MWAGDARSIKPIQCPKVGPEQKTLTVIVPDQGRFVGGVLTRHEQEWSNVTNDPVTLQAIRGVKLPMIARPPVRRPTREELNTRREEPAIDAAIKVAPYQVLVLVSLNFLTP